MGRFTWGCVNYDQNLKLRSRKPNIFFIFLFFIFLYTDQHLLWHEYTNDFKRKTTWKSEVNWQLELISSGDRSKMWQRKMGPDIRQLFVWYHVWRKKWELEPFLAQIVACVFEKKKFYSCYKRSIPCDTTIKQKNNKFRNETK